MRNHVLDGRLLAEGHAFDSPVQPCRILADGRKGSIDLVQVGRDLLLARGEFELGPLTRRAELAREPISSNAKASGTRHFSISAQNCLPDRARPSGRADTSAGASVGLGFVSPASVVESRSSILLFVANSFSEFSPPGARLQLVDAL